MLLLALGLACGCSGEGDRPAGGGAIAPEPAVPRAAAPAGREATSSVAVEPTPPEPTPPEPTAPEPAPLEPAPDLAPASVPQAPRPFLGSELDQEAILEALATAQSREWKPVGTSSVVFRVRLRGPVMAAYKPRSRQHRAGYLAEVAAYRVARLLGLDNVPPVILRRAHMDEIHNRLHRRYTDSWEEIRRWTVWDADLTVPGAAIYWVPDMQELGLDAEGRTRDWLAWLDQEGTIPAGKEALARDLSNLVAFDYLIGNWDRWSGANVQGLPSGERLFMRDHNVAFHAPLPEHFHQRILQKLLATERFSRGLVEALDALDEAALRGELARDPSSARDPILTDRQIADVLDRREALRSHVGALIDRFGVERVLCFE